MIFCFVLIIISEYYMNKKIVLSVLTLTLLHNAFGQRHLQPNFCVDECEIALKISAVMMDTSCVYTTDLNMLGYKCEYESPDFFLSNKWELWTNDTVAYIVIRGSYGKDGWIENFYMAMVPSVGQFRYKDTVYTYCFARMHHASVHAGWAYAATILANDMIPIINQLHQRGYRDIILSGHSQGGVLSLLVFSYLHYSNRVSSDILFKIYANAAPKPGNLNYVQDLEYCTRGGWAYRVFNMWDWVPQFPLSIQQISDIVVLNPFSDAEAVIEKMKPFWVRFLIRRKINAIYDDLKDAQRDMTYYFGKKIQQYVGGNMGRIQDAIYTNNMDYTTCCIPIPLCPDSNDITYMSRFPQEKKHFFVNHRIATYLYLLRNQKWD